MLHAEPAAPLAYPTVTVGAAETAPTIDGRIGANEWPGLWLQGFCETQQGLLDPRGGRISVATDGTMLFVAIDTPVHPRHGAVARNQNPYGGADPEELIFDDSIELWLVPGLSSDSTYAYRAMFNTLGGYSLARFETVRRDFVSIHWDFAGDMVRSSRVENGRWVLEAAIPLASLGGEAPADGVRMRVCRNFKLPFTSTRDSIGSGYNNDPERMMRVPFAAQAPLVNEPDWGAVTGDQATVSLRNPTDAALTLTVNGGSMTVAAGATAQATVAIITDEQKVRQADLVIHAEDGRLLYQRQVKWSATKKLNWDVVL